MLRSTALLASLSALVAPAAAAETLLLIPDTGADKVWAFSAFDGSVVSNNYIPNDGRMKQVMQVVQLPGGTILMSDPGTSQSCDAGDGIREYTPCGQYIRTVASTAEGVCNPEGICVAYGKVWFVRLYDAAQEDVPGRSAIWSMTYDGLGLTESCPATVLDKPWGILPFQGGLLVSDSTDDNVERIQPFGCVSSAPFVDSNGVTSVNFPQQMALLPDGGVAIAGFSSPSGLYFFTAAGDYVYTHLPAVSCRGVYPLGNGEILYTGGTRVLAYDPKTFTERDIVNQSGASFRWISPIERCSEDLDCSGGVSGADLGVLLGNWGSPGAGDLNGSGSVDGADLGLLLSAWGGCSANPV